MNDTICIGQKSCPKKLSHTDWKAFPEEDKKVQRAYMKQNNILVIDQKYETQVHKRKQE